MSQHTSNHQFINLRLDEKDSLFPEGLAGDRQGEVAYVLNLGTGVKLVDPTNTFRPRDDASASSLIVMRREAADAVVVALDAFATGGAWGETWRGGRNDYSEDNRDNDKTSVTGNGNAKETDNITGSAITAAKTAWEGEGANGEEGDGEGGDDKRKLWKEAARLAEAKRKPLNDQRRVRIQPQQVQLYAVEKGRKKAAL